MSTLSLIAIATAAYLAGSISAMLVLGRVIRAGTGHLDRPLPPHSLQDGRPFLPPRDGVEP